MMNSRAWLFGSAVLLSASASAVVINMPDFSDVSSLTLNGSAAQVGNVLRVTPEAYNQAGSAFSTTPITLINNTSFSTYFKFRISRPTFGSSDMDGPGADGLVFVVQTVSSGVGGMGGGIGYLGIPNSLGVEFDTWNNGSGSGDPDGNHVNFDYGGSFSSTASAVSISPRMNDGDIWYAWIDYNGNSHVLELRLGLSPSRPGSPLLAQTVDLPSILGSPNVFAGFTSGTGAAVGNHDVLAWEFRDDYAPIPEPAVGTALFGFAALGATLLIRRKKTA